MDVFMTASRSAKSGGGWFSTDCAGDGVRPETAGNSPPTKPARPVYRTWVRVRVRVRVRARVRAKVRVRVRVREARVSHRGLPVLHVAMGHAARHVDHHQTDVAHRVRQLLHQLYTNHKRIQRDAPQAN